MRPWLFATTLAALALAMIASSVVALRQSPHPDMFRPIGPWDFAKADWWLYPLERNAFKRTVVNGDLNAVYLLPGTQKIWVAGAGGRILHSEDGGATWTQQHPAPPKTAAPAASLSLVTTAYAAELRPAQSSRKEAPLARVPALGKRQLMEAAAILAKAGLRLGKVTEVSSSAPQGTVLKQFPAAGQAVSRGSSVAVVIAKGAINRKEKSAPNTKPVEKPTSPKKPAQGKANTPPPVDPETAHLESIFFVNADAGWAVGAGGTILATRDGGKTWQAQTSGKRASLSSVQFLADGQRGWAVGDGGIILATSNGGENWRQQKNGHRQSLNAVNFLADGQRGWAVGDGGIILVTSNGGESWRPERYGKTPSLYAVTFLADGQRGWAVGDGIILATVNGGKNWRQQKNGERQSLYAVMFLADGRRGWAVGKGGTVLATGNGGENWRLQTRTNGKDLQSVQFLKSGQRGWAVGKGGTILATSNGGDRWYAQSSGARAGEANLDMSASYARYPAPWYLAVLLLLSAAGAALLAFVDVSSERPDEEKLTIPGAATTLRSDEPVADKAQDRLGYRPAVEALAAFIRNKDTDPRVTLAVTGEWGSGKSSIMRMLQTELRRAGFRTAWFNAWHQQQEGRPLTALFNAIREQAVPSVFRSPIAALRVRSRLIWGRGWLYRIVAIAVPLLVLLALGDLLAGGRADAARRVELWFDHYVLHMQRTVVTRKSLEKLSPFVKAEQKTNGSETTAKKTAAESAGDPCDDGKLKESLASAGPLRPTAYCFMKHALLWNPSGNSGDCTDLRRLPASEHCVFTRPEDLIATVSEGAYNSVGKLWPSERNAIAKAAETLPPPALFPGLEYYLLPLAALLGLFVTKGASIYGLQLIRPLQNLLVSGASGGGPRKEPTGTIERYRTEFALLADALDGRLVVFIDDLDRCTAETVTAMMELTNYLVDVGRCFVVVGADMDRVMCCIKPPSPEDRDASYAGEYLRKLVHIELPVPQHRDSLSRLFDGPARKSNERSGDKDSHPVWTWLRGAASRRWPAMRPWVRALAVIVLTVGPLAAAFIFGGMLHEARDGVPQAFSVRDKQQAKAEGRTGKTEPNGRSSNKQSISSTRPGTTDKDRFEPPPPSRPPWVVFGTLALLVTGAFGWRLLRQHRERVIVALGGAIRSRDSDRFIEGLAVWRNVVSLYDPTPRGIKRFYNRARLFGAYDHEDVDALRRAGASVDPTDDAHIVAMAAIHHADPKLLERLMDDIKRIEREGGDPAERLPELLDRLGSDDKSRGAAGEGRKLAESLRKHVERFHALPSGAEMQRFYERVERIHVR